MRSMRRLVCSLTVLILLTQAGGSSAAEEIDRILAAVNRRVVRKVTCGLPETSTCLSASAGQPRPARARGS